MNLVDMHGRPIPSGVERERAEGELKEFLAKNKPKVEDWLRRFGPVAFPVKYNLEQRRWFWVGKD